MFQMTGDFFVKENLVNSNDGGHPKTKAFFDFGMQMHNFGVFFHEELAKLDQSTSEI